MIYLKRARSVCFTIALTVGYYYLLTTRLGNIIVLSMGGLLFGIFLILTLFLTASIFILIREEGNAI